MFGRRKLLLIFLLAAGGIPYLSSNWPKMWHSLTEKWSGEHHEEGNFGAAAAEYHPAASTPAQPTTIVTPQGQQITLEKRPAPPEGGTAIDLGEVLRFDITTAWVTARWPRVSAGLAELDLQGYRVPLVTGVREDDLAGSLTYYFDKQQHVKRITFHGSTGDSRRLVAMLTDRFGFARQATDDPSLYLYQVKWMGKAHSELRIRPARVVRAESPRERFEVTLVMDNAAVL